jgi:hypothetical protein
MSDETTKHLFIDYLLCENSCLKTQCSQTSELLQTMQFNVDMLNNVIENTFDVSGNMSSFVRIQVYDNSGNVVSCVTTDCCGNFIPCMEFDSSGNILPCVLPPMNQMVSASAGERGLGLYGYPYGYRYGYPYDYDYGYGHDYGYGYPHSYLHDYYPYNYLLDDCYRDLSGSHTPTNPVVHPVPLHPISATKPYHPMPRPTKQRSLIIAGKKHALLHRSQQQNPVVHPPVPRPPVPHPPLSPYQTRDLTPPTAPTVSTPVHPVKPRHFHGRWGRWGRHGYPYPRFPHF